ncbi:DUF6603 domain-containing protein [Salipiger mucosus]|uniref:DUF6603 domain-containing protein n=1 Tax=Salipiger mucosus DSM 16094 TaxID=1123237 RepID=S9RCP3_9RHOB|nr:DUF6603 domain-containing protein [Salipiger mucosus]EPX75900.1 hypothetical protein Salmuc_01003 [Salipiger mucosus DSM 16094]
MWGAFTFHAFGRHTITIDVGADLTVWGPEFSGNAHVSLHIVSFDVSLGAGAPREAPALSWAEFARDVLPAPANWLRLVLVAGQRGEAGGMPEVTPAALSLRIETALPATAARCGAHAQRAAQRLGVAPCHLAPGGFRADFEVSVHFDDTFGTSGGSGDATDRFAVDWVNKQLPAALWGDHAASREARRDAGVLGTALHGAALSAQAPTPAHESAARRCDRGAAAGAA